MHSPVNQANNVMIQFHLSKTLSKDLAMHLGQAQAANASAMQWYAHRVTVLRRKCIIAMEWQSRYCMVFCGLTKNAFSQFPEIFADRLWREAVSLCQLDEHGSEKLVALVDMLSAEQHFQTGSDRSVQAHINDVAWHLKNMAEQIGHLPESPEDAFGFGVQMNDWLRKCKSDKDYFKPIEVFQDFWLGMLEHLALEQRGRDDSDRDRPISDNVILFHRS